MQCCMTAELCIKSGGLPVRMLHESQMLRTAESVGIGRLNITQKADVALVMCWSNEV